MPLRRLYRRLPLIWQLTAALTATLVIIAGLVISTIADHQSNHASARADSSAAQSKAIATCVNQILGDRAPVTAADSAAVKDFMKTVLDALVAPPAKTTAEQTAYLNAIIAKIRADYNTYDADDKYRAAHPLGRC